MKNIFIVLTLIFVLTGCRKKAELPVITTGLISSITQTTAVCKGYLFSEGSCMVISKGICWSTSGEPTISNDTIGVDSSKTFTIKLTGLTVDTKYYIRSFAINCEGTGYGEIKTFNTSPPSVPKVYTSAISSITKSSATVAGGITSDGAASITDQGICWGTSENPAVSDNFVSAGPGSSTFNVTVEGLKPNTDYFVRAYAINSAGTGYGNSTLCTTSFEPDPDLPVDPDYPTAFSKLSTQKLTEKILAFTNKNKYIVSTLNEFGFCSGGGTIIHPPHQDTITQQDVIETVKKFALLNPEETGIENPNDLTFSFVSSPPNSMSGDYEWRLITNPQKIGTMEVIGAIVYLDVMNRVVVSCNGNWYPHIYVPQNFFIDQEQAKMLLIGRVVCHYDIAGYKNYTRILGEYLGSASITLSIVPFTHDDKIELRVTWQIKVPHADYKMFVDVLTGEIVYMEPTRIS